MARFAAVVLLLAWAGLGVFAQNPEDSCRFSNDAKTGAYNLEALKTGPENPHRFYNGPSLFKINFCGAAACASVGATPTPGCKQATSAQGPVGESTIGNYMGMLHQEINMNDVVDINFKNKGIPSSFPTETKGVKVYYPGPVQQGAGGNQMGGNQMGGNPQQPATPGFPSQQSGPQQPAWGNPAPPPDNSGWPAGRRLLQWPASPNQAPQQQPGAPGQQQGGYGPAIQAEKEAMTVFILCNPSMTGNPRPVIFAPGMEYKTRDGGFMFVMEHAAGCASEENFIERATGGLAWGYTFLIALAIFLVVYCGCGIFYKTKKLGVTGIEAIPNIEFWRDYPSMVKEGCGYSMATFLNCIGKGNGGYAAV